jgi:uncharacterized protein with ATP-grasp and redox domains
MRDILNGRRLKVQPECFPCFLRQTAIALGLGTADDALKMEVMRAVLKDVESADTEKSPAHATTPMHRTIRRMLGRDPFGGVKADYNRKALALYPRLKRLVAESGDPLRTASRLAIAGNVIDFGIYASVDIEGTVERALGGGLAVDRHENFAKAVDKAGRILYLLDNAGEAIFDRVLIEELASMGKRVTAVAKGSPVINDCTASDARDAGLGESCEVIDNGSDAVGTILETTSDAFRRRFGENSALVISKGQGNFETLMGERRRMFFLLQSKCGVLSRFLGLPEGSMLLAEGVNNSS